VGDADVVVEFVDTRGRVAAGVSLPERVMFWSDGRFERCEAFGVHHLDGDRASVRY
jgi:hypothetical protein